MIYKSKFPFGDRDFVLYCTRKKLKDGRLIIASCSTTTEMKPLDKYVRADIKCASWILKEI